ncbi:Hypothetical_protein [Hexamita inflata]|uniref:Hypothetical_protein n=1 Tax=Hexamita inflata TaxID=28002 RepID=A0AA86QM83_9EUKA|nr:Hypothetical protein HINF_LOCUS49834 [Hexamita inflata]
MFQQVMNFQSQQSQAQQTLQLFAQAPPFLDQFTQNLAQQVLQPQMHQMQLQNPQQQQKPQKASKQQIQNQLQNQQQLFQNQPQLFQQPNQQLFQPNQPNYQPNQPKHHPKQDLKQSLTPREYKKHLLEQFRAGLKQALSINGFTCANSSDEELEQMVNELRQMHRFKGLWLKVGEIIDKTPQQVTDYRFKGLWLKVGEIIDKTPQQVTDYYQIAFKRQFQETKVEKEDREYIKQRVEELVDVKSADLATILYKELGQRYFRRQLYQIIAIMRQNSK